VYLQNIHNEIFEKYYRPKFMHKMKIDITLKKCFVSGNDFYKFVENI